MSTTSDEELADIEHAAERAGLGETSRLVARIRELQRDLTILTHDHEQTILLAEKFKSDRNTATNDLREVIEANQAYEVNQAEQDNLIQDLRTKRDRLLTLLEQAEADRHHLQSEITRQDAENQRLRASLDEQSHGWDETLRELDETKRALNEMTTAEIVTWSELQSVRRDREFWRGEVIRLNAAARLAFQAGVRWMQEGVWLAAQRGGPVKQSLADATRDAARLHTGATLTSDLKTTEPHYVLGGKSEDAIRRVHVQRETSASIATWQNQTFGPAKTTWERVVRSDNKMHTAMTVVRWHVGIAPSVPRPNLSRAIRAVEELAELIALLVANDDDPKAPEECADIDIVLRGIDHVHGTERATEVDRKMRVNRRRAWAKTGDGHGQHAEKGKE